MRRNTAQQGRAARAQRRGGAMSADAAQKLAEGAFLTGLRDTCPRCGLELEGIMEGEQFQHLRSCTDSAKHAAYQKSQQKEVEVEAAREQTAKLQQDAAAMAAWNRLGGR